MSRDSGADQPTQRTVAELLAEYGGSSDKSSRRRRRKAEDPTETAPQEIINRVLSDSGKMRPVNPDEEPPAGRRHGGQPPQTPPAQPAQAQPAQPQPSQPPQPQAAQPPQPTQAPQTPPPAAQQPPQAPPAAPQQAPETPADPPPGSAGYWAQRFSSAGNAVASGPPAPSAPSNDAEATIRQPALPTPPPGAGPAAGPAGPPVPPAGPPQLPESFTEQIPRIDGGVGAYPAQAEPEPDPFDFDDQSLAEGGYDQQPYDQQAYDEPYDQAYDEDYDRSAPAGLDDDYDPDEGDRPPSAGKEWGTLALQGVLGLVGGGAVWVGFRWLWINATIAAFGAALVFTGLLVLVAWKFFRTNDLQTILLSVLVGLFCTVSPAALLLINQ
ncbi:hypothetical protein [Saccharopolyspora flava]|uniref:Uncharacterized protein n=1 Tax=Saccharopolyspora flava TaxID=95161 RepID=A0A1I6Q0R3_9PSEU|nr:hypothetical protein [Saccharopolyspora flava]SFS46023.1 hypothetical protein SAMN05660874_01286 [Saccharopolyspora flava]